MTTFEAERGVGRHNTPVRRTVPDCIFCQIATNSAEAVIVYQDADLVAFLDSRPIRRGHILIIPRSHIPTFDVLDARLATLVISLGQQLARRMKVIYRVDRVGFLFAGSDVAHVHAHVVPMHERMDIASAQYLISPAPARWDSEHLQTAGSELELVSRELDFRLERPL